MKRCLCLLTVLIFVVAAHAEETGAPGKIPPRDKTDESIEKAIGYLLSQQKEDGSIHDRKYQTTMTSLSIMALFAAGHMPDDKTKEGEVMRKALEFVLRDDRLENVNDKDLVKSGYFGQRDGSRMYGHGIITLMLGQAVGMGLDEEQDRRIRARLEKAVELILWSQGRKKPDNLNHYGGWRYGPTSADSDLSATIWQLLALRAAKNAGLDVPKEAIDKAIGYVKRCYHSSRDKDGKPTNMKSACSYQPGRGPSYASGAAGLLSLQVCGEYEAPEVKGSADWLRDHKLNYRTAFFFYGTYYYAQGMYQRGGEYADHAKQKVEGILLKEQQGDGSWQAHGGHEKTAGKVYTTSMAVMSLSVRYHYLPIYQR